MIEEKIEQSETFSIHSGRGQAGNPKRRRAKTMAEYWDSTKLEHCFIASYHYSGISLKNYKFL